MTGAPALAARGALRAGAGLVRIGVPASVVDVVAGLVPEATTAGLPDAGTGALVPPASGHALDLAGSFEVLVLGPGAGRAPGTPEILRDLALLWPGPLVIDADGLFAFAGKAESLARRTAPTVLTPHEGEAQRLLAGDGEADRVARAAALQRRTGAVVVLKGPGTLVVDRERLYVNATGGPALASGGTGDVLAGVVGALLAGLPDTGGDAFGAAAAAVHAHGLAGDVAADGLDRGVLASDVADRLPQALATLIDAEGT
jgi:NAD(P)H-hydrate epimerase